MPLVSRLLIKAGLLWLAGTFILGILIYFPGARPEFFLFRPVFYHMAVFGWVTQVIMGVAFWLFPRHSKEKPRASYILMWLTFYSLNAGLILRVAGEPAWDIYRYYWAEPLIILSVLFHLVAAISFAYNSWYRFGIK